MQSSDNDNDIDALLAIVEGKEDVEIKDSVSLFIDEHNIEDGKHSVFDWQLYWHYNNWSQSPVSLSEFKKAVKKRFPLKEKGYPFRNYGRWYFKLNNEFEVPYGEKRKHKNKDPRWQEKSKAHNRKWQEKIKKKKNEVSGSE